MAFAFVSGLAIVVGVGATGSAFGSIRLVHEQGYLFRNWVTKRSSGCKFTFFALSSSDDSLLVSLIHDLFLLQFTSRPAVGGEQLSYGALVMELVWVLALV